MHLYERANDTWCVNILNTLNNKYCNCGEETLFDENYKSENLAKVKTRHRWLMNRFVESQLHAVTPHVALYRTNT